MSSDLPPEAPSASASRRASLHISSGICSETTTMKGDEHGGAPASPLSPSTTTFAHSSPNAHTPSQSPTSLDSSASVSLPPPHRGLHCIATPTPQVPPVAIKDAPIDVGNIENTPVEDDPRLWSSRRKLVVLAIISFAALAPTTGAFIYQPAIQQITKDLNATSNEIALSLSLFILFQGNVPLIWASISEIKGRKLVYILSMIIFIIGSAVGGASKNMPVLICMRMFQAAGSSAVLAIGAGTLADIYSPKERGTMMGIYYAAPLLGPSIGPLFGGILSQVWSWRATFYFLTIIGGVVLLSLFLFKDTWRRERSLTYQSAKRHAIHRAEEKEKRRVAKLAKAAEQAISEKDRNFDTEKGYIDDEIAEVDPSKVKVTLVDLNPFKPIWSVLKRKNNLAILIPSALLFALQYSVCYTTARTFAAPPYNYNPLKIGMVLLSFGLGNMCGSVMGGKWSDIKYSKLKAQNGGEGYPEMRLKSTLIMMGLLPPSVLGYAWTCQKHTHVAGPVICLFVSGFAVLFIYSSTLAYIVDSNAGRSTAAVASNSSFRGISGLVSSEIAAPLQDAIGDGGLYTLWAGLLLIMEAMILLVIWKGRQWREQAEQREREEQARRIQKDDEHAREREREREFQRSHRSGTATPVEAAITTEPTGIKTPNVKEREEKGL